MAVTWDSDHKGPDLVLSDGDLTITHGASSNDYEQVLATLGRSSGKWYFELECVIGDNNYDGVGVGNGNESLETHVGDTSDGWSYMSRGRFFNKTYVYNYGTVRFDDGDVVMIAVDLDNGKIWWGKNGSWLHLTSDDTPDPAAGTDPHYSNLTGTLYPAAFIYSITSELKGRFLSSAFSYTPPTGFSAWDPGFPVWDSDQAHSNIAIEQSGKAARAATAGTDQNVISSWSKTSGKWYFEIKCEQPDSGDLNNTSFGICNTAGWLNTTRAGWGESWAIFDYSNTARFYHNGSYLLTESLFGFAKGVVIQVAMDLDNGKLWFGRNGAWASSGDPANGTNPCFNDSTMVGKTIAAVATPRRLNDTLVITGLDTELTYSVPSGFSAIETGGTTTFLEDLSLNLSAYFQELSDLGLSLTAQGYDLRDLRTWLQAAAWDVRDFKTGLSAYYQGLDDIKARLAVWGYDIRDLPLLLSALARGLDDLPAHLSAAAQDLLDIKTSLQAVDGLVLRDLALLLSAADGTVLKDLAVRLSAIKETPAFVATVAQRLTSIISEVT